MIESNKIESNKENLPICIPNVPQHEITGKFSKQTAEIPTLFCSSFQPTLWSQFGTVAINSTNTKIFRALNPSPSRISLSVEKAPLDMGVSIYFGEIGNSVIEIGPNESIMGFAIWSPTTNLTLSETAKLKFNNRGILTIKLTGISGTGGREPLSKRDQDTKELKRQRGLRARSTSSDARGRSSSLSSLVSDRKRSSSIDSLNSLTSENFRCGEPTKFKGLKECPSKKFRNSSLYQAKYTEDKWVQKQIDSFTKWINFALESSRETKESSPSSELNEEKASSLDHDWFDATVLSEFKLKQEESKVRLKAFQIYNSAWMRESLRMVDGEITKGTLCLRDDNDVLLDIGLQDVLFEMLFSYNIMWLRLGFEVVYGEVFAIPPNFRAKGSEEQKWKKYLKLFMTERLLSDPFIEAEKNKCIYASFTNERRFRDDTRRHLLKKLFALILFLDHGRQLQLLPSTMLFNRESSIKSSKDFLIKLCKEFMKGQGDILKQISNYNYTVTFEQEYIHEFEFRVTNLAVDLRDGVRLVRLIELLSGRFDLTKKLRVPANSRLQKKFNVELALKRVQDCGLDCDVSSKDIVDGNRDRTLMLLWSILFHFDLRMLIESSQVFSETSSIQRNSHWRRSIYRQEDANAFAVSVATRNESGTITFPSGLSTPGSDKVEYSPCMQLTAADLEFVLMDWCATIARQYDVFVENLTTSLADGRALCLLMHYYHPNILPIKMIRKTTACLSKPVEPSTQGTSKDIIARAIEAERFNYYLLRKACRDIGGIPLILPVYDSKNIPERKTMLVFLGYLFARLIETSELVRSAIRIQRVARKFFFPKMLAQRESARIIQLKKRERKMEMRSIESSSVPATNVSVVLRLSQQQAAFIITRKIRAFLTRKVFLGYLAELKLEDAILTTETEMSCVSNSNEELYACCNDLFIAEVQEKFDVEKNQDGSIFAGNSVLLKDIEYAERIETILAEAESQKNLHITEMDLLSQNMLKQSEQQRLKAENDLLLQKQNSNLAVELALSKVDEARLVAEVNAQRSVAELRRVADEQIKSEKEARIVAELHAEEEARARQALEEKLLALEVAHESATRARLDAEKQHKEMEEKLLREALERERKARTEAEQIAKMKADEDVEKLAESIHVEKTARELAEIKAQAELETRLALEAKLKSIEDSLAAVESAKAKAAAELLAYKMRENIASKVIQKSWRKKRLEMYQQRLQNEFLQLQEAKKSRVIIKIQSLYRGIVSRSLFVAKVTSCIRIQSVWRQVLRRKRYLEHLVSASLLIQTNFRRFMCRSQYLRIVNMCVKIQSCVRAFQCKLIQRNRVKIASKLQKFWRKSLQRSRLSMSTLKQCEEWKKERANQAGTKISSFARHILPRIRVRRIRRALCSFQAIYRGYFCRSSLTAHQKRILESVKLATVKATNEPSLKLGARTEQALYVLQTKKKTSQLLDACKTLELSTRLSPECCHALAHASTSSILFTIIRTCDRSESGQELLRISLVILLHVARHNQFACFVAKGNDATDVVIHLMQMFRDRAEIFGLSCELLCRLVEADVLIKNHCNKPDSRKCLDGIRNIIETKHKLNARVQNLKTKTMLTSPIKGKGKYLASAEPVHCMRHLMGLLNHLV